MKIPRISPEIYGLFHSLIQGSFFSFQSTRRTTPAATRTPATIPMGIQIENDDFSPASPPLSGFPATAALDESASPADEPSPCKGDVVAVSRPDRCRKTDLPMLEPSSAHRGGGLRRRRCGVRGIRRRGRLLISGRRRRRHNRCRGVRVGHEELAGLSPNEAFMIKVSGFSISATLLTPWRSSSSAQEYTTSPAAFFHLKIAEGHCAGRPEHPPCLTDSNPVTLR